MNKPIKLERKAMKQLLKRYKPSIDYNAVLVCIFFLFLIGFTIVGAVLGKLLMVLTGLMLLYFCRGIND